MKISADNFTQTPRPVSQIIAGPIDHPSRTAGSVAKTDLVSQLQQTLKAMPEVDLARVCEIKATLEMGEPLLDCRVLASAIIDFYRR